MTGTGSGPFRFCPGCGVAGGQWIRGHEYRCPACGFRFFQNVAAAVGVLIEDQGRFLFVVRAKEPSRGLLGLPGGFIDNGESAEGALAREVREEIGATLGPVSFLASFPNQYLFAGVVYQTCDLYFRAPLATGADTLRTDPDEVAGLVWLAPDDVDPGRLAFPSLRSLWALVQPSLRTSGHSR